MSTGPDLTPILDDLAAGRIDAAEAGRRIEAAKRSAAPPDDPEPRWQQPREEPRDRNAAGVERVSIRSVGRRVRVEADASVPTVAIDGPHTQRRNAGTIEVMSDGEVADGLRDFNLLKMPRSLDDLRTIGLGRELVVRMNPRLVLDVEVTASGLAVEGVPQLGRIRVTAGGASLKGVEQVSDALVQAGSLLVEGPVSRGRSRVKCESGTLTIVLTPRANVTLRGHAQMGRITWPGEPGTHLDEFTVGNGSARLDLEIVMGMATVREDEQR